MEKKFSKDEKKSVGIMSYKIRTSQEPSNTEGSRK